jgi:hypothetical protein
MSKEGDKEIIYKLNSDEQVALIPLGDLVVGDKITIHKLVSGSYETPGLLDLIYPGDEIISDGGGVIGGGGSDNLLTANCDRDENGADLGDTVFAGMIGMNKLGSQKLPPCCAVGWQVTQGCGGYPYLYKASENILDIELPESVNCDYGHCILDLGVPAQNAPIYSGLWCMFNTPNPLGPDWNCLWHTTQPVYKISLGNKIIMQSMPPYTFDNHMDKNNTAFRQFTGSDDTGIMNVKDGARFTIRELEPSPYCGKPTLKVWVKMDRATAEAHPSSYYIYPFQDSAPF